MQCVISGDLASTISCDLDVSCMCVAHSRVIQPELLGCAPRAGILTPSAHCACQRCNLCMLPAAAMARAPSSTRVRIATPQHHSTKVAGPIGASMVSRFVWIETMLHSRCTSLGVPKVKSVLCAAYVARRSTYICIALCACTLRCRLLSVQPC
jgi:hypothetical protein